MVPGEGGGLGLGPFVLYNERKLIEKEGARKDKREERAEKGEAWWDPAPEGQGQAFPPTCGVMPGDSRPPPQLTRTQTGNDSSYLPGLLGWESKEVMDLDVFEKEIKMLIIIA